LNVLKERAEDFIGSEIIIGEDSVGWVPYSEYEIINYWDFIIKIGKDDLIYNYNEIFKTIQ
jgi:hypothetical protein